MTNLANDLEPDAPNLIIYGGSFDPPHQGHVDCLHQVLAYFPSAAILITPSLQPAGAAGAHKAPTATYQQRLEMCSMAFGSAALQARVTISSLEQSLPTPNYTVTTLVAVQHQHPEARLALLMGQDQFRSFARWREPHHILRQADLIVIRRDSIEHGFRGHLSDHARTTAKELGVTLSWNATHTVATPDGYHHHIYLVNEQISLAESSLIRSFVAAKQPLPDGWLPEPVAKFIKEQGLYV